MSKIYTNQNKTQRIKEPLFQVNRTKYRNGRQSELENVETNLLKLDLTRIESQLDDVDTSILDDLTLFIGDIDDINESVLLDDGLSYNVSGVSFLNDNPPKVLERATVWLDAGRSTISSGSISNIGSGGSSFDATFGSNVGTVYNGPKFLDHNNDTNYIYLPGNSGNYVTVEDSASLDITGDIEFVCRVALDDWSPALAQAFVGKWTSGTNQRSYYLQLSGTSLTILVSSDGLNNGASEQCAVTFSTPIDGNTYWIKGTRAVGSGLCSFFYAPDQATEPTSWTSIGTNTMTYTGSIFSGTGTMEVGTVGQGTAFPLNGKFYRAIVRNGIGGITVLDLDFTTAIVSGSEFSLPISGTAATQLESAQYLKNSGTGGNKLDARLGSTGVVDSNDPKILNHTGTNYVYLPGVSGNYVSIPDNPSLNITGNIELVARVSPASWTPTTYCTLAQKNNLWYFRLNTSGKLEFVWYNGTAYQIKSTTQSVPVAAGVAAWVKTTFTVATGQARFYYATDQTTEPSVWTELTAPSAFGSTTMVPGAGVLALGSNAGGTEPWIGGMYRFIVRNGIAGTAVVDVDFTTSITSGNQVSVPFTGTALSTYAPQYVSNLGTGGRALVARSGSLPNADGNDPLLLTHTGENYFYSTSSVVGATGPNADNYAVIPDNGAMELLGSNGTNFLACTGGGARVEIPNDAVLNQFNLSTIEIVMRLQVDKLANTALTNDNLLITKGLGLGASGGFFLSLLGTGGISLGTSLSAAPGSPQYAIASGFSYPLGTPFWLKAVRYTSTGAVTFYQQPDQATEPTSWGTAVNGTGGVASGALGSNANSLTIGAVSGSGGNVRLYRTIIRPSSPSTNPVLDLDFSSAEIGATVIPDQSQYKAIATAAGGAKIVDGSTFLSLAGIDGNYATTPDNGTILDVPSSNMEIVFRIAADNYSPAGTSGRIASKLNGANVAGGGGYEVYLSTGGFNFQISSGALANNVASTSHGVADGQPMWGRVTWTTGTGATAFFWAADSPIEPTSWTAIGTATTTVTTIADSAMDLRIGNMTSLSRPFAGKIYRVIVRNTTSGATVFDADFSKQVALATTFNEGSANNALVTIASTSNASKITSGTTFLSLHNTQASAYRAAVPTNTAYDLAGDYEIVFRCTPSANVANAGLVVRDAAWRVLMDAADTSKIVLAHYATATSNWPLQVVSFAGAFVVGTTRWYKVTRTAASGDVAFYYAADQAYEPTTWTAFGTGTIATAPETAGAQQVQFGSRDVGLGNFSGRIYNVKVRNGIGGASVAAAIDADFTQQTQFTTSFTERSSLAATVSLTQADSNFARIERNRDVEIVCRVAMDDWYDTATASPNMVGKGFGNDYWFYITSTTINIGLGSAPAIYPGVAWAVASRPANGVPLWLKVTRSASAGVTTFYSAPDQVAEPTTWTTIGATTDTRIVNTRANTGYPMGFGAATQGISNSQYNPMTGKFYRAIVRNGIAGQAIVDIDFTKQITSGTQTSIPVAGSSSQLIKNLGATGSALNAKAGKYVSASDTSDPLHLPFYGDKYWYQPGISNGANYMSTPSTTDVSITGDIALAVQVQLDDITSERGLLGKRANGVDSSFNNYQLGAFSSATLGGTLAFSWTTTAGTGGAAYGAVPHGIPAGKKAWVGVSLDVDNGSGGYTCRFYRSFDGVNWTNYETQTTTAGVTNIRASAATTVNVGGDNTGAAFTAGKYYAAKIWSGLDLTANPVLSWSANDMGQTGGTSNGRAWTASRGGSGRKGVLVEAPVWLFGGDDFMEAPDHADINFATGDSFTVIAVTRQWNTIQINGQLVTKGAYTTLTNTPGWLLYNSGTTTSTKFLVSDTVASPNVASSIAPTAGTINVMAGVRDRSGSPLLRTYNNGTASTTVSDTTTLTLTNTSPLRIGSQLGTYFGTNTDFELIAVAVFKSALSAAQITTITNHYTTAADSAAVALLNTAKFWIDAASSQQKALVVRSTSGRKAATVVRPTFLFGTNDYMDVADNDLLDFGLSDSFTLVAALRQWGTPQNDVRIFSKGSAGTPSSPAISFLQKNSLGTSLRIDAGTAGQTSESLSPVPVAGALTVFSGVRNAATDSLVTYSGASAGASVTDITTLAVANTAPFRIGADYGGGTAVHFGEFEMYGAAVFRKALTATEVALINTHYQGTETTASNALLATAVFWIDPAKSSQEMAINRSTTGRKSVAVTRPTFLFGTDDYMEVADNALLSMDASQSFTVVAVVRQWATPASGGRYVSKAQSGTINGYHLVANGATLTPLVAVGDGVTSAQLVGPTLVEGAMSVFGSIIDRSAQTIRGFANNTIGASASTSAVGTAVNNYPLRIGSRGDAAGSYQEMELFGATVFRRALTQTEITLINTHYQGAETTESVALLSSAVFWADAKLGLENRAVINRASSGRKTVAVTRPVLLFGTTNTKSSGSYVTNLGTGGSVIDALRGSTAATGTDTVDPAWLTYSGENYLYLPGISGNFISAVDTPAVSQTGDMEIVARVALDNWVPSGSAAIVGKWGAAGDISYLFNISSIGQLMFWSSPDGTNTVSAVSTIVPSFVNGNTYWIRVTLDADNGSGTRTATFYSAPDQILEPIIWTPVGSPVPFGVAGTTFDSGTTLNIGAFNSGSTYVAQGKFFRVIIRNAISGGTTVFDSNFTTGITSGSQASFTESSVNAATVTINRATSGRKSVAVTRPVMLFGADDYLEVANNSLLNFANGDSFTMFFAGRTWPTISSNQRLITKNDSNTSAARYLLYLDSATGNPFFVSGDGTNSGGASPTTQPMTLGNLRVAGVIRDVSLDSYKLFSDNTISTGATDTLTGSMSNTSVLRIGSSSPGAGSHFEGELFGSAIFRRVLTSTEIALINTHYTTGPTSASIALLQEAVLWIDANLSNQDDHLKILDSPKIDFGSNQDFTFLALARTWGVPTSDQIIISKETQTGLGSGWSLVRGASNLLKANVEDSTGVRVSTPSLTLDQGQFRLLYGRRNSVTNKLYVGSDTTKYSVTDTTTSSLASDKNLLIGKQNFHPDSTLDAEIFAVLILPSDLTDAELLEIYNYYNNTAPETSIHTTNKLSGTLSRLLSKVQRLEKSKNV